MEKLTQLWFDAKRKTGLTAIKAAYNLHFKDNEYGNETRDLLAQNKKSNLLLYFNHLAYDDPLLVLAYHESVLDPLGQRKRVLPLSHWNTNAKNNPAFTNLAQVVSFVFHTRNLRIIQHNQIGDEKYGYTLEEARGTYRNLLGSLMHFRTEETPITLFVAPEGHRSEIRRMDLRNFEKGIMTMGKILAPTVYLPLGISYFDGYQRDQLNFRSLFSKRKITLEPGKPFFQANRTNPPTLDNLIVNLNDALSPQFQARR